MSVLLCVPFWCGSLLEVAPVNFSLAPPLSFSRLEVNTC
jgi:hypothetical protein